MNTTWNYHQQNGRRWWENADDPTLTIIALRTRGRVDGRGGYALIDTPSNNVLAETDTLGYAKRLGEYMLDDDELFGLDDAVKARTPCMAPKRAKRRIA